MYAAQLATTTHPPLLVCCHKIIGWSCLKTNAESSSPPNWCQWSAQNFSHLKQFSLKKKKTLSFFLAVLEVEIDTKHRVQKERKNADISRLLTLTLIIKQCTQEGRTPLHCTLIPTTYYLVGCGQTGPVEVQDTALCLSFLAWKPPLCHKDTMKGK